MQICFMLLATKLKYACSESDTAMRIIADCKREAMDQEPNVQFLTDKFASFFELYLDLTANETEIVEMLIPTSNSIALQYQRTASSGALCLKMDSTLMGLRLESCLICNSCCGFCTSYSSLLRTEFSNHRVLFNAVLPNALHYGEIFDKHSLCVGEEGYCGHLSNVGSFEQRDGHSPLPRNRRQHC